MANYIYSKRYDGTTGDDKIPKIRNCYCGAKAYTMYIRRKVSNRETLETTKYAYCRSCSKVYPVQELDKNNFVIVNIKGRSYRAHLSIPKGFRMQKAANKWGQFSFTEEEYLNLINKLSAARKTPLKEVIVRLTGGMFGTGDYYVLIPEKFELKVGRKTKEGIHLSSDEFKEILRNYNSYVRKARRGEK